MAHNPNETTVVLIEDEEILSSLLSQKLEKSGYRVIMAADGEAGYDAIMQMQPDMVLLDMMLPKLNGFGVLERLHEKGVTPELPVIVISNSGQPVEIDRAEKLGISDYLVKLNFDPDEVIEKMKAVLDARADGVGPVTSGDATEAGAEPASGDGGDVAVASAGKKPVASASGNQVVLIIEDDMFIADLLGRKLHEKFDVHQATDTKQAENILNNQAVNIICLDIMLPGEDGYTFLGRIKQMDSFRDIPVIILSNLGQQEEIEKGMNAGASDYLVKANMAPDEILKRVEEVLSKQL